MHPRQVRYALPPPHQMLKTHKISATNADQAANELRAMKAKLFDGLKHIHLVFVFQSFPYTAHGHKQSTLCHSVPARSIHSATDCITDCISDPRHTALLADHRILPKFLQYNDCTLQKICCFTLPKCSNLHHIDVHLSNKRKGFSIPDSQVKMCLITTGLGMLAVDEQDQKVNVVSTRDKNQVSSLDDITNLRGCTLQETVTVQLVLDRTG